MAFIIQNLFNDLEITNINASMYIYVYIYSHFYKLSKETVQNKYSTTYTQLLQKEIFCNY